jgi:hypothetical protein
MATHTPSPLAGVGFDQPPPMLEIVTGEAQAVVAMARSPRVNENRFNMGVPFSASMISRRPIALVGPLMSNLGASAILSPIGAAKCLFP